MDDILHWLLAGYSIQQVNWEWKADCSSKLPSFIVFQLLKHISCLLLLLSHVPHSFLSTHQSFNQGEKHTWAQSGSKCD